MNIDTVEGDMRQDLGAAEKAFGEAAGDIQMTLRGKADEWVGKAQSAYGEAKDRALESIDAADAFVSEKPYLTAILAAVAGVAIGYLLGVAQPKVIVIRQLPPKA
jgi:uncharacterized protein YjbJ (UPF0337 family)